MADCEDDEEEEFEIEEPNDSDFADDHGESTTYVIQILLCTRRPPTLRSGIKSFIQDVRSRAKYATSSLTIEVRRISFLEHL